MKKAVVTGGAGFIGSHLVEALREKGLEVKVIDNLHAGRKENLASVMKEIEFVEGDVRNIDFLLKEFRNSDIVFHEAALHYVRESVEKPLEFNEVNVSGTLNVLEAARKNNVKRVVFASTCAVYGNAEKLPLEENAQLNPLNPYAITKIAGEMYAKHYFESFGLETVSLRYFNAFGPRQPANSPYSAIIPIMVSSVLKGKKPKIFGTGEQSRDFVFVKDIARANISAMGAKKEAFGKAINIGTGKSTSITSILNGVNNSLGKSILAEHLPGRKEEIFKIQSSVKLAKKLLGFECKYTFEKGLKETIEWFKKEAKK